MQTSSNLTEVSPIGIRLGFRERFVMVWLLIQNGVWLVPIHAFIFTPESRTTFKCLISWWCVKDFSPVCIVVFAIVFPLRGSFGGSCNFLFHLRGWVWGCGPFHARYGPH